MSLNPVKKVRLEGEHVFVLQYDKSSDCVAFNQYQFDGVIWQKVGPVWEFSAEFLRVEDQEEVINGFLSVGIAQKVARTCMLLMGREVDEDGL